MQAIFINMATDKQDLEAMINKAKAFQIDGRNVAMWARYLAHVYKDYIGEKMDGQLISKYEGLKSMPKSFVDAALIARNAEDADDLAKAYMGGQDGRHGYANTHDSVTADDIVRQVSFITSTCN